MKLCKEMIDAMGGQDSEHYRQFQTYCCEAYNILRKSAGLLLSLLHLMAGASIPEIQKDPGKAVLKLQVRAWERGALLCASGPRAASCLPPPAWRTLSLPRRLVARRRRSCAWTLKTRRRLCGCSSC